MPGAAVQSSTGPQGCGLQWGAAGWAQRAPEGPRAPSGGGAVNAGAAAAQFPRKRLPGHSPASSSPLSLFSVVSLRAEAGRPRCSWEPELHMRRTPPSPNHSRRSAGAPCCVSARAVSTQRRGNSVGPSDGRRVNLGSHSVPTGSLSFWETWIWLAKEGSRREAAGKRSGSRGRSELEPSSLAIVPGGRDPGTAWFPGVALAQAPSRGSSQGPSGRVR